MSYRTILELVAASFLSILLWNESRSHPAPVGQYQSAQVAPEVKNIPREKLNCKPIYVYLPAAKSTTNLPPEIKNDPNKYVLNDSTISSSRRPQELVTIYDAQTGENKTLVRESDYPWLQTLQTGYIGMGYGYTNGITQKGYSVFAHEDLLAVKALRFGVDASVQSGGSTFVGVSATWGW